MLTLALAFQFVMQHPQLVANGVNQLTAPGNYNQQALQGSVEEISQAVLKCYHKTARMQGMDIAPKALPDESQYGADSSTVVRIRYTGLTGSPYYMIYALLARGSDSDAQLRAVVLQDTARVPYAQRCLLQDWTSVGS